MARDLELDNGIKPGALTKTLQRVYAIITLGSAVTPDDLDDLQLTAGWAAVTEFVLATYGASMEADATFTPEELGSLMYKSLGRGMEETRQRPWEELPARERLAWEVVARHAAFAVQADDEDLEHLADREQFWGRKYLEEAHKRGVALEQVH